MSTLANISYVDGDVVWVRLSNSWWPGEVVGESRIPEGLLASLKKQPIAVVRFFQESTFEYVYSIDKICLYNNQRKHTFIKKGLEAVRAKKKFMETFPDDVAIAEKMVNGDPDIINSEEFQPSKVRKETWSDIFVDPNKKQKIPKKDTPSQVITHRNPDHEIRILEQSVTTPTTPVLQSGNPYKCRACPFSTNRMNVFILHNKSHTKEELASPKSMPKTVQKTKVTSKIVVSPKTPHNLNKILRETKKTTVVNEFEEDWLNESETEYRPIAKRKRRGKNNLSTPGKTAGAKQSTRKENEKTTQDIKINTEIKNKLLADWSDDELGQEEKIYTDIKESVSDKNNESFENLREDSEKNLIPIKCHNIPKKRDFVFSELKEDEQQQEKKAPNILEKIKHNKTECQLDKNKMENNKEKQEKFKEQEKKRKHNLKDDRKSMDEKQDLEKQGESALLERQLIQRKAEVERRKKEFEQKRVDIEKKKIEAKKKTKGDFDLLMEQLEETPPLIRVSRRNKNKRESPLKLQKNEDKTISTRKMTRHAGTSEVEIGEDEALAQEIKELLKETSVPDVGKKVDKEDRKLPPKERGKRIFKEAQQVKSPKIVDSPSKIMTESELLIAETLTQLPQTAIQFSPKKIISHDNDIAESLINLSTPPKPTSSVPQSSLSNSNSPILNPRKRHLRALEEIGSEEKSEAKQEILSKRQRKTETTKDIETQIKLETRLPKKRKAEYHKEFESIVNKSQNEAHKQQQVQTKSDETLFDINNMEILFDSEPVASNLKSISKQENTSTSTTMKVVRKQSHILHIKQDSQHASPKEQKLRQEVTPTHRKVMKLITQIDGRKTLIEEVQPNLSRASPTTSLIVRASSSSPLAKSHRSMSKSPTSVTPKPQVIVGRASNKILITSKGSLMTTTSPVTSTTARSNIRTSNKIQVQSEIIIPSNRVTSRTIEKNPVTTVRTEINYSSQSRSIDASKEKLGKSNVIKLSPQQLREAESLGYVEVRGNGKVLTKAGLKEYLPKINAKFKLKRKDSDTTMGSLESTSHIDRVKPIDSSVTCIDADDSPQKNKDLTIISPPISQNYKSKPIYKTINNEPIVIPDEDIEPKALQMSEEKSNESIQEFAVKSVMSESSCNNETPVISVATTQTSTKENNNLGDQNSQILAVSAENFGGPSNAFYLCSVGEDGSFTPMNNEALYLDASNQLVPMVPEIQDKIETDQENSVVDDDATDVSNQSIIFNTGDGQQIILDQQSLLAMAVSGDVSQLFTQDGQQLIYPGSAQEILNAIAASQNEMGDQPIIISNQDILTSALSSTDVYQQDHLLTGPLGDLASINPPVKAHVSETNTVLTQSPIMSTIEQPTKNNGNMEKQSPELIKNLDEKLAEIGVTSQHQTNVPVSLELPITVTNPAIAPKTSKNLLEMNSIYPASMLGVAVSSTLSTHEKSSALVGISSTSNIENPVQSDHTSSILLISNSEISDDFVPDTPEPVTNNPSTQDGDDTNSSEIPLQPNIGPESLINDSNSINMNNNDGIESEDRGSTNDVTSSLINNNRREKQEFTSCDSDDTFSQLHASETLNEQLDIDESL